MAKALFGHVGVSADMRLVSEVSRLRGRVGELEAEIARLRCVNDALAASVSVDDDLRLLTLTEAHALT